MSASTCCRPCGHTGGVECPGFIQIMLESNAGSGMSMLTEIILEFNAGARACIAWLCSVPCEKLIHACFPRQGHVARVRSKYIAGCQAGWTVAHVYLAKCMCVHAQQILTPSDATKHRGRCMDRRSTCEWIADTKSARCCAGWVCGRSQRARMQANQRGCRQGG